jgi:tol-pal system protein YbgF
VLVLRERVARLEKRLADVDARLGLLLARGETAPASAPRPLRFDEPRGEQRAVDLLPPPGDPLAAIDIDRAGPADDGPPIVDVEPSSGPDESVHLTLKGTPRSADDDTSGDPLAAFQSAEELYGWAQEKRKDARYLEAIAGFEDVVSRFAVHDLADNAAYWVGWCHQQRGDHRLALDVWQKLPAKYPRSAKVPDALFGMGQSHEALGEPALAEALYDEVVSSYPKAEKLKDARKALARLRPPQR